MPTVDELERLLERDPDDTFLNFGLAMALAAAGRDTEALARFERTLALDSRYVPAHFQRARLLGNLGRVDEAREGYRTGIRVAREVGDEHAAGEMEEFLAALDE